MTEGNTGMNALIGGAVTVVLAFLPFAAVLGGAVAGYLQRGDYRDGAAAGALSGVIALLPLAAYGALVGGFLFLGPMRGMPGGAAALGAFVLAVGFVAAVVYFVGAGALGGLLGTYLVRETDLGLRG